MLAVLMTHNHQFESHPNDGPSHPIVGLYHQVCTGDWSHDINIIVSLDKDIIKIK